jgi:predicted transcriptional regulator
MTDEIKEAIDVLRKLPDDKQHTVARAILDYAADDEVYRLSDYERGEVRAGFAEIERGEIASDDEVRAVYKRVGI